MIRRGLCLLALIVPLSAQQLPPDAVALKSKRDARISEINRTYAAELEKLQKKAMDGGNLTAANEIQREIATVAPEPLTLDSSLLSKRWVYSVPGGTTTILEFLKEKTAVDVKSGDLFIKSWRIKNRTELVCAYPDGNTCTFQFASEDSKRANGITNTGAKRTLQSELSPVPYRPKFHLP